MARATSGLQYPERFYAAASYAGFDGSPRSSSKVVRSKFNSESALLLYALHQQVSTQLSLFLDPNPNSSLFDLNAPLECTCPARLWFVLFLFLLFNVVIDFSFSFVIEIFGLLVWNAWFALIACLVIGCCA